MSAFKSLVHDWNEAVRPLDFLARSFNDAIPSRIARVAIDPIGSVSRVFSPSTTYQRLPAREDNLVKLRTAVVSPPDIEEFAGFQDTADGWDSVLGELDEIQRYAKDLEEAKVLPDDGNYHNITKRSLLTIPASMYTYYQIPGIGKPQDRSDEYILVPSNMTY